MTDPDIDGVYRDLRDVPADSLSDFDEISYTHETGESALAISGALTATIPREFER